MYEQNYSFPFILFQQDEENQNPFCKAFIFLLFKHLYQKNRREKREREKYWMVKNNEKYKLYYKCYRNITDVTNKAHL